MPNYKLTYFEARARGEPSRMLFHLVGQKYEDIRYDYEGEEWPKIKGDRKSKMYDHFISHIFIKSLLICKREVHCCKVVYERSPELIFARCLHPYTMYFCPHSFSPSQVHVEYVPGYTYCDPNQSYQGKQLLVLMHVYHVSCVCSSLDYTRPSISNLCHRVCLIHINTIIL